MVEALRSRHYSRRTEEAYLHWIRRFLAFHSGTHPRDLAESDVNRVGYAAYQFAVHGLPSDRGHRSDLLTSLCLAAAFEHSGRSRALVYEALHRRSRQHPDEIADRLNRVEEIYTKFEQLLDLKRGRERLRDLRSALGIPQASDAGAGSICAS